MLAAVWMKRARVKLGLPVSYARTPSGSSPLNALARLILGPNPSEPHTLGAAEHCQNHLPAWVVFERQTCADSAFCWISRWFLGTQSFWYLTLRLVSTLARLLYACFKDSDKQLHRTCLIEFSLVVWDSKVLNSKWRQFYRLVARLVPLKLLVLRWMKNIQVIFWVPKCHKASTTPNKSLTEGPVT